MSSTVSPTSPHTENPARSPVPNALILAGYICGGVCRGVIVGALVTVVALFFTELRIHSYTVTIAPAPPRMVVNEPNRPFV